MRPAAHFFSLIIFANLAANSINVGSGSAKRIFSSNACPTASSRYFGVTVAGHRTLLPWKHATVRSSGIHLHNVSKQEVNAHEVRLTIVQVCQ